MCRPWPRWRAIGAFGTGTTAFVVVGLLPQVAKGFDGSVPTALLRHWLQQLAR